MNDLLPFDQITLSTERLLIRPMESGDAAALFEIFSDTQVTRYWSGLAWENIDQAHELIAKYGKSLRDNESLGLGIINLQTNTLIGTCSLFHLDVQCRRAEIGYGMASSCWGKGYMYEALTALINFGFNELNLHRMEADIDPRNVTSLRSVERLGFVKEGHLRERWIVDGVVSDSSIYGLLCRDWQMHLQARLQRLL